MIQIDMDITCPNCQQKNPIRFRLSEARVKEPKEKYRYVSTCKKCGWGLDVYFHIFIELVMADTKMRKPVGLEENNNG